MKLSAELITPLLRPHTLVGRSRLDHRSFPHSVPIVHLSATLSATLSHAGTPLDQRSIDTLHLSVSRAWAIGADNLIRAATAQAGVQFLTRCVTADWVQVDVANHCPSAWLAHPITFKILHDHLRSMLGGDPVYLAASDTQLFASTTQRLTSHGGSINGAAVLPLLGTGHNISALLSPHILGYRDGFPREIGQVGVTAPATPPAAQVPPPPSMPTVREDSDGDNGTEIPYSGREHTSG